MKIYRGFFDPELKSRKRAIAIGMFDGVHLGHRQILKKTLRSARVLSASPMVITFDPHPSAVLSPKKLRSAVLMSLAHRLEQFKKAGMREALVVHFDKKFSKMSREEFLEKFLLKRLGMRSLCVGHDFCFGNHAAGNGEYLKKEAAQRSFALSIVPAVRSGRETISSTRIRELIETGQFPKAEKMLGRPVSVMGTVVRGRGRGRSVGFPTANLNPHHEILPPGGVYAGFVCRKGRELSAVIHIGERPTFSDSEKSLEAHFLGFHGNVYGEDLELVFVKKIRSTQKFSSSAALAEAIARDIAKARKILSKSP